MILRISGLIITLALGILLTPLSAAAQQPGSVYRIGFLMIDSRERLVPARNALLEGSGEWKGITGGGKVLPLTNAKAILPGGPGVPAGDRDLRDSEVADKEITT